ncbi:MAG: LamG domain-containing protein, partial [Candidatus Diapherotrites archaeon]|nr:LamG domain-containing protein [Candidatus Diapherotrites archaeon]
ELSSGSATGDVSTDQKFDTGKWSHVVGRFDGTKGTVFVNGIEVASRETGFSAVSIPTESYDRVRIGGEQTTNNRATDFFKGAVDELIIYKRALSDSEIDAIYLGQNLCPNGGITSPCYCGGVERTTGYCCDNIHQTSPCSECTEGTTKQCGTTGTGECSYGAQTCTAGIWEECIGSIEPTAESITNNNCTDEKDNDCNGKTDAADEGCIAECIDSTKLVDFIAQWKQGNITLAALMQKMKQWKAGTGC